MQHKTHCVRVWSISFPLTFLCVMQSLCCRMDYGFNILEDTTRIRLPSTIRHVVSRLPTRQRLPHSSARRRTGACRPFAHVHRSIQFHFRTASIVVIVHNGRTISSYRSCLPASVAQFKINLPDVAEPESGHRLPRV